MWLRESRTDLLQCREPGLVQMDIQCQFPINLHMLHDCKAFGNARIEMLQHSAENPGMISV